MTSPIRTLLIDNLFLSDIKYTVKLHKTFKFIQYYSESSEREMPARQEAASDQGSSSNEPTNQL